MQTEANLIKSPPLEGGQRKTTCGQALLDAARHPNQTGTDSTPGLTEIVFAYGVSRMLAAHRRCIAPRRR